MSVVNSYTEGVSGRRDEGKRSELMPKDVTEERYSTEDMAQLKKELFDLNQDGDMAIAVVDEYYSSMFHYRDRKGFSFDLNWSGEVKYHSVTQELRDGLTLVSKFRTLLKAEISLDVGNVVDIIALLTCYLADYFMKLTYPMENSLIDDRKR